MAQFTKNNKRNPLERHSSQGLVLGCPICAAKLDLLNTRDGDQAYWCHRCQSGWRAGNLPEAAHRSKDSAIPEPQVQAVTPVVEARVTPKARASVTKVTAKVGAVLPDKKVASAANPPERQRQLAALAPLAPLTRPSGRPLPQGEAKKQSSIAPRVGARSRAAEVIASKSRAAPRAPASEPKAVAVKTATPSKSAPRKRVASPRAADVVVSPRKTVVSKEALNKTQKKPLLETSPKDSRRTAQPVAPVSKPVKAKRQPLEVIATPVRPPRTSVQKRKTLEIAASTPQPKRLKRLPLEIAAPIKVLTPRAKRSAPELVISGKGSRKSAAPAPKAPTGKRQPLEVTAKPKVSVPRVAAQKPLKKTLETVAPIKAPGVKSRRDKPALETGKGARQRVQTAASLPKAVTGKRQKLEAAAPKVSARAALLKPRKTTLETAAPIKPSRRKKPVLEIATVAPQKTRQRKLVPVLELTPKPRRAARIAAPVKPTRAVSEQRKSRNVPIGKGPVNQVQTAPVSQPRAKRLATPLEPIAQSRRAARVAAKPTPAPIKPLKAAPIKPELNRAARVTKQPAAVAPRPKPTRSSTARHTPVAPSNPVQFGLFDALPPKTAARRSAK